MRGRSTTLMFPLGLWMVALAGFVLIAGCKAANEDNFFTRSWLDQSELVPAKTDPGLMVPILKQLSPRDEQVSEFAQAEDVKAADLKVFSADYIIGKNDVVAVSVFDLMGGGQETLRQIRVSESGMLTLPAVNEPIKASGLTESQLQKAIAQKYVDAKLLTSPEVSVTLIEARQRTFSILGAVGRSGQYQIVESNFRVLDALVLAGDVTYQPEYIYIVRRKISEVPATQPPQVPDTPPGGIDPLAPRTERPIARPLMASDQPVTTPAADPLAPSDDDQGRYISVDGQPRLVGTTRPTGTVPVAGTPADPSAAPADNGYKFGEPELVDDENRIIRIPYEELRNGDLRFNVVIRPNDTIMVPVPPVGEFYMGGHVARPGVYALSPRGMTIKQAVISAGMLDPLGVPQRSYVIRQIKSNGQTMHLFVRVDVSQVFSGQQSDVFLRPNDQVLIGTNPGAIFLSAIRGAFRLTYGFGFVYDRNYAYDSDNQN